MTIAFYRSLYGEDFFQESVESVIDHVDKVYMLLAHQTWGGATKCTYHGRTVYYPEVFDRLGEIALNMERRSSKVRVVHAYNPLNKETPQWALRVIQDDINELRLHHVATPNQPPTWLLFMEPDMAWKRDQLDRFFEIYNAGKMRTLTAGQVELWRKLSWRVPYRAGRASSFLWDVTDNSRSGDLETTEAMVHNLGFCVSDRAMFWKHMIGLGISGPLQDSMPNEDWLEKTWLSWHPTLNNHGLEIAKGREANLEHAIANLTELPEPIIKGVAAGKWPWLLDRVG